MSLFTASDRCRPGAEVGAAWGACSICSPPNHPDGTVHKTKAEAEAVELAEHRQEL